MGHCPWGVLDGTAASVPVSSESNAGKSLSPSLVEQTKLAEFALHVLLLEQLLEVADRFATHPPAVSRWVALDAAGTKASDVSML